jgi:hypothetical protein
MKVWRERQRLDFPSFYVELSVIEALRNPETIPWNPTFQKPRNVGHPRKGRGAGLGENVRKALRYLAEDFAGARAVDPANSNHVISDDLGAEEKGAIARAAGKSLAMTSWESVLW